MNDRDIEDTRQPKDEPEAVFCDECGEEKEYVGGWYGANGYECKNTFCPRLFDSVSKEMAILIVEQKEEIRVLKLKMKNMRIPTIRYTSDIPMYGQDF